MILTASEGRTPTSGKTTAPGKICRIPMAWIAKRFPRIGKNCLAVPFA